ncbi:MAG: hypothetical protein ACR2MT_05440 [Aurantibacter sp.]
MYKTLRIQLGLIFIVLFTLQNQAQNNQYPSQERVETLLEQIDECKEVLADTEKQIKTMEGDATNYSLADYQEAKNLVDRIKTCLSRNRGELDAIRKDYPGWFNSPSLSMPLKKGKTISPKELEKIFDEVEAKIKAAIERMNALAEPEH